MATVYRVCYWYHLLINDPSFHQGALPQRRGITYYIYIYIYIQKNTALQSVMTVLFEQRQHTSKNYNQKHATQLLYIGPICIYLSVYYPKKYFILFLQELLGLARKVTMIYAYGSSRG